MSGAGFSINAKLVGELKNALDGFVTTYAGASHAAGPVFSWISPAAWSASLDWSGHHADQAELFRNLQIALEIKAKAAEASGNLNSQFFSQLAALVLIGKIHQAITGDETLKQGTNFAPAYAALISQFEENLKLVETAFEDLKININTLLGEPGFVITKDTTETNFAKLLKDLELACWTPEFKTKFGIDPVPVPVPVPVLKSGDVLSLLQIGSAVADGRAAPVGPTPLGPLALQDFKDKGTAGDPHHPATAEIDMNAFCRAVAAGISTGIPSVIHPNVFNFLEATFLKMAAPGPAALALRSQPITTYTPRKLGPVIISPRVEEVADDEAVVVPAPISAPVSAPTPVSPAKPRAPKATPVTAAAMLRAAERKAEEAAARKAATAQVQKLTMSKADLAAQAAYVKANRAAKVAQCLKDGMRKTNAIPAADILLKQEFQKQLAKEREGHSVTP